VVGSCALKHGCEVNGHYTHAQYLIPILYAGPNNQASSV
jgi:hypothetical protein